MNEDEAYYLAEQARMDDGMAAKIADDNKNKKLIVAIDLDGTLAEYDGWTGWEHIGAPLEGAINSIVEFKKMGFEVIIFTTRLNPEMPDSEKSADVLMNWLVENEIVGLIDKITGFKPYADIYIDDRGLRFETWEGTMKWIKKNLNSLR